MGAGTPTVIKKYANRRLYNTATSTYVTLEHLAQMVRDGQDFAVFDARSGDDITRSVLTQIIVEAEGNGGQSLLPLTFLRDLIRSYGQSVQGVLPNYLELSMKAFTEQQEQWRGAMGGLAGPAATAPLDLFQTAMKRNAEFLAEAAKAFTGRAAPPSAPAPPPAAEASSDDLAEMRAQLAAMQARLDRLGG